MKKRTIAVNLPLLSILLAGQGAKIMQTNIHAATSTSSSSKLPPQKPSGNMPGGQKPGNKPK